MATIEERLRALQKKVDKKKEIDAQKKAIEDAKKKLKTLRGK